MGSCPRERTGDCWASRASRGASSTSCAPRSRAGGPVAVRRAPAVAVNPYVQTALAWQIGAPLHDVQATWTQRTDPRRPAGGLLFRAPATLAGPVPLAGGAQVRLVARAGRWKVLALLPEE